MRRSIRWPNRAGTRSEWTLPAGRPATGSNSCLLADYHGAAAVEMALVMPFALMLLLGIIQFGGLLFLQNTMTQVSNDVVRRVAVGDLSETDAVTEVETRLADWSATFTVVVDAPTANDVRVAVSVPMADAALIDVGHWMGSNDLSAEATMRME